MAEQRGVARQRAEVMRVVGSHLAAEERVIALLAFAVTPKRPKPPSRVREGIYQSYRRYRPLVITDRRIFVLDAARTPHPRAILAEFPFESVSIVDVVPRWFGQQRLFLDLPGVGTVPFDLGRHELDDLARLRESMPRE